MNDPEFDAVAQQLFGRSAYTQREQEQVRRYLARLDEQDQVEETIRLIREEGEDDETV